MATEPAPSILRPLVEDLEARREAAKLGGGRSASRASTRRRS